MVLGNAKALRSEIAGLFFKNQPSPYTLSSGESKEFIFNLKDGEWALNGHWAIPKHILKKQKGYFIKVKLEIEKTDAAMIHHVFTGKVESDWVELK